MLACACSSYAICVLLSVVLFATTSQAIALPNQYHAHGGLEPRRPVAEPANGHDVAVTLNNKKEPNNFLKDLGNFLGDYNFFDIVKQFFGSATTGGRANSTTTSAGHSTHTTTVLLTPTPVLATSSGSAKSSVKTVSTTFRTNSSAFFSNSVGTPIQHTVTTTIVTRGTTTSNPLIVGTRPISILPIFNTTPASSRSTRTAIVTNEPIFSILPIFNTTTVSSRSSRTPLVTDEPIFSILPFYPSSPISRIPVLSINGTATAQPTTTAVSAEGTRFSILPWFPPNEHLSDNVTAPLFTDSLSDPNFDRPPRSRNATTFTPTATAVSAEGTRFSILPWFPPDEHLLDNVTSPQFTYSFSALEADASRPFPTRAPNVNSTRPGGVNPSDLVVSESFDLPLPTRTYPSSGLGTAASSRPLVLTNPLRPTVELELPSLNLADEDATSTLDVLASFTSSPLVLTNPLRPTVEPDFNVTDLNELEAGTPKSRVEASGSVSESSLNFTFTPIFTRPLILTNPLRPTLTPLNLTPTAEPPYTTTTFIKLQSTTYVTVTVLPTPVSGELLEVPRYPNTSLFLAENFRPQGPPRTISPVPLPSPVLGSSATTLSLLIPIPTLTPLAPDNITTANSLYPSAALETLRIICSDPTIKTLTLPLLDRFYGPSAYPALLPYPGCEPANSRQALQAPGLLNCSLLGVEVQNCQRNGRRVLLSIKADPPSIVDGDLDYGRAAPPAPLGVPLSPGPFAARPGTGPLAPQWPGTHANLSVSASAGVQITQHPNLFDELHPPTSLALTLFSLFGEGHTERADLRPLGPDTPSPVSPDGTRWLTRPLGEEVVLDGFDVRVPSAWKGTYQSGQFDAFAARLRELNKEAWTYAGGETGTAGDLGADGIGVVVQAWS